MSANRPKFQHPSSFGAFAPRARAKRKRRRRRARTIPFSSGLSIDSSIGEEAREREGLRGGQRAKKDKRIDREGIMRRALFFVSMRTHLCETMTKKRRARARTRGASSSSRKRALKRPYSPPLRARAGGIEFERPLFSSVAVYRRRRRVWRFVFCISFSEKPTKDKKGVDILVFKKKVKKTNDFLWAKFSKRKSPKGARAQSRADTEHARAGGMRER